jgi:hypothetical protein
MSDIDQELDWDSVLGEVDKQEEEDKKEGKGNFDALPKDDYPVLVQEAEKRVAQSSGNDMINVRLQVTEGPFANRVLFTNIVFSKGSPKGMRMTLDKLAALGVTREFLALNKPSPAAIAEMLVGRRALASVDIQGPDAGDFAGRNEVKRFKAIDGLVQEAPAAPAAAAKPGVPSIPTPVVPVEETAPAAAPAVPQVPVAQTGAADDPFAG